MHVSQTIIRDPRVSPQNLQPIIDGVLADIDHLQARIEDLAGQLALAYASQRIGMHNRATQIKSELDGESKNREVVLRTLEGLRAIEAARDKALSEAAEQQAAADGVRASPQPRWYSTSKGMVRLAGSPGTEILAPLTE